MIHLLERLDTFEPGPPAPKPRAMRTPAEVAGKRAFDEQQRQQHIRDMQPAIWIALPVNIRPRNERGPFGMFRRRKGMAS